jgi:hypothetical protein
MPVVKFNWRSDRQTVNRGWDAQEIAEFYRISEIMAKAGLEVDVDQGRTDEGDPWFVFVRPGSEEVLAHFARIDGYFVSVSAITGQMYRGLDVRSVINQMLEKHPLILPKSNTDSKLYLHPSVVLMAFVAAAFVLSVDESKANNIDGVLGAVFQNTEAETAAIKLAAKSNYQASMSSSFGARSSQTGDVGSMATNNALLGSVMVAHKLLEKELVADQGENKGLILNLVKSHFQGEGSILSYLQEENSFSAAEHFNGLRLDSLSLSSLTEPLFAGPEKEQDENNFTSPSQFGRPVSEPVISKEKALPEYLISEARFTEGPEVAIGLQTSNIHYSLNFAQTNFENDSLIASIQASELKGEELKALVINTRLVFDEFYKGESGGNQVDLGGLGLTITSDGELFAIGISEGDLLIGPRIKSDSISENIVNVESVGPDEVDEIVENIPLFRIDGHFIEPTEMTSLMLSNQAIDVVVYDGGDVQISGFELGKDLLFFLQPDLITSATTSMLGSDTIVIDFEETGSLTIFNLFDDFSAADTFWG